MKRLLRAIVAGLVLLASASYALTPALKAVLFAPAPVVAAGGITQVQAKFMTTNAFGTVHTWTPDAGLTTGNTLIVGFAAANSTLPIVSIQTNTAVALTLVASLDNGSGTTSFIYRLTNAGSGVTSIVMTLTEANGGTMHGVEIAGAANSSPVDVTNTGTNGFETGPHDDVTVTTMADNDAVFALFRSDLRTIDAPASGYTALPASGENDTFLIYDIDVGSAGAKAPGISYTDGAGSSVVVAAIKKL